MLYTDECQSNETDRLIKIDAFKINLLTCGQLLIAALVAARIIGWFDEIVGSWQRPCVGTGSGLWLELLLQIGDHVHLQRLRGQTFEAAWRRRPR